MSTENNAGEYLRNINKKSIDEYNISIKKDKAEKKYREEIIKKLFSDPKIYNQDIDNELKNNCTIDATLGIKYLYTDIYNLQTVENICKDKYAINLHNTDNENYICDFYKSYFKYNKHGLSKISFPPLLYSLDYKCPIKFEW